MQPDADIKYLIWGKDPSLDHYLSKTPLGDYLIYPHSEGRDFLYFKIKGSLKRLGSYPSSEEAKKAASHHYSKLVEKENDKMFKTSYHGVSPEELKQIQDAAEEYLKDKIASYERVKEDVEKQRAELERKESMLNLKIALASAALRDAGHNHMADFITAGDASSKKAWSAVEATNIAK